jgi:hypothetical protein
MSGATTTQTGAVLVSQFPVIFLQWSFDQATFLLANCYAAHNNIFKQKQARNHRCR